MAVSYRGGIVGDDEGQEQGVRRALAGQGCRQVLAIRMCATIPETSAPGSKGQFRRWCGATLPHRENKEREITGRP